MAWSSALGARSQGFPCQPTEKTTVFSGKPSIKTKAKQNCGRIKECTVLVITAGSIYSITMDLNSPKQRNFCFLLFDLKTLANLYLSNCWSSLHVPSNDTPDTHPGSVPSSSLTVLTAEQASSPSEPGSLRALAELGGDQMWVCTSESVIHSFIHLWLRWVFVAVCRLSLVVASRGYSSLRCTGFSLRWLPLLWSTGSRRAGFSSCSTWAQ